MSCFFTITSVSRHFLLICLKVLLRLHLSSSLCSVTVFWALLSCVCTCVLACWRLPPACLLSAFQDTSWQNRACVSLVTGGNGAAVLYRSSPNQPNIFYSHLNKSSRWCLLNTWIKTAPSHRGCPPCSFLGLLNAGKNANYTRNSTWGYSIGECATYSSPRLVQITNHFNGFAYTGMSDSV